MLMKVGSDPRACNITLVHTQIKSSGIRRRTLHTHCSGSQTTEFNTFFVSQIRVVRDMAVGTDQQMPGVIRKEIHQNETADTAMNDEPLFICARWRNTKRTLFRRGIGGLVIAINIGHSVRRP